MAAEALLRSCSRGGMMRLIPCGWQCEEQVKASRVDGRLRELQAGWPHISGANGRHNISIKCLKKNINH